MKLFISNPDWTRVLTVLAAAGVFWAGIASLVPAKYSTVVNTILGALTATATFLMRSGKYVENRDDKPTLPDPAGK